MPSRKGWIRISSAYTFSSSPAPLPKKPEPWAALVMSDGEERIAIAQKQGMEPLVEPTVGRWFPPEVAHAPHVDKVRRMIRATPVEVPLTYVLGTSAGAVRQAPLLLIDQSIPKLALAPIFVIWFGTGMMSRIVIAIVISFFPMVVNTARGLTTIDAR